MHFHYPSHVLLDINNHLHDNASTPRNMHQLDIDNNVGCTGTSNYYVFNYFNSHHYCFIASDVNNKLANDSMEHLHLEPPHRISARGRARWRRGSTVICPTRA